MNPGVDNCRRTAGSRSLPRTEINSAQGIAGRGHARHRHTEQNEEQGDEWRRSIP